MEHKCAAKYWDKFKREWSGQFLFLSIKRPQWVQVKYTDEEGKTPYQYAVEEGPENSIQLFKP